MGVNVERVEKKHGRRAGLRTLEQRFVFADIAAAKLAGLIWTRPLIGAGGIFGECPGAKSDDSDEERRVRGFRPAPTFAFDVILRRLDASSFRVRFAQPEREVPYLSGEFLWLLSDEDGGAMLDEQINTERALAIVGEPLTGSSASLRRWLFFRAGHASVMMGAARRLASLG